MASLAMPVLARGAGPHASTAQTSRWWRLDCPDATSACRFVVKLRGPIDRSRLQLVRHASSRRDAARRALGRDVALRVDVDTRGGDVFAAMEIGRLLRAEQAAIEVRDGASCISACVLLMMGAVEKRIGDRARVAIHRPSLADAHPGDEAVLVGALRGALALYAQQMGVPRGIVDAMMSVRAEQLRWLSRSDLLGHGIRSM